MRNVLNTRPTTRVGVIAAVLMLALAGLGLASAQAAPDWKTPADYRSDYASSAGWAVGYASTIIRSPNRIRFKVNVSDVNTPIDFTWTLDCERADGETAHRQGTGTWGSGGNKQRIFEPDLPFANRNRAHCQVLLQTIYDDGWVAGRIQTVR